MMGGDAIHGYAAVFYNPDDPGTEGIADDGVTRLRIFPGAFDDTLADGDCEAWYGHRERHALGGIEDGNLTLSVDAIGLRYEIRPVNAAGRNVVRRIERGKLAGSSWQGYATESFAYTSGDGRRVRELRTIRLIEVGPCTVPRFKAATCWIGETAVPGERPAWADEADRLSRELSRMRLVDSI